MIAIVIWTCLTVFFLGGCSKYYIVTSSVCCCFVCYFDCRTTYFYVCDHWCIWCNCCYFEFLSFRPLTKYFLSVCITCPSVAVCIVSSLLYILERCRCAYLIFVYRNIIFVCDAIFICRDYIIITSSAFCFTGKDNCCSVSNNFDIADHRSTDFQFCLYDLEGYFFCSLIVLSFGCNGHCTISNLFVLSIRYSVICIWCQ